MRLLLFIGFLTIFISCIFIMFFYDMMMDGITPCMEQVNCNQERLKTGVMFGFTFMFLFVVIDLFVLYFIYKSFKAKL